ncbi:MAG: glycosyltransferase family 61 protein [Bacteroidia bacterium]|nr:glycosyltransferase family 61 protein [Bacteroidia bacterium]
MTTGKNIIFQKDQALGSTEHFWHFIFGYLLPLTDLLIDLDFIRKDGAYMPCRKIYVPTCGPLMDKILDEVLPHLYSNYEIVTQEKIRQNSSQCETIMVPRWDNKEFIGIEHRLLYVVSRIKELLSSGTCCKEASKHNDKILLLKRSPQPEFYAKNGPAEIKSYGTTRRSLLNLEESSEKLKRRRFPVSIYEPGAHNLYCQIITFQNACGIIGIAGAEFTNLIWVPQGIPVIVIRPAELYWTPPPQRRLCEIFNLKLHILISQKKFLELDVDIVSDILQTYDLSKHSTSFF